MKIVWRQKKPEPCQDDRYLVFVGEHRGKLYLEYYSATGSFAKVPNKDLLSLLRTDLYEKGEHERIVTDNWASYFLPYVPEEYRRVLEEEIVLSHL